MEHKKDKLLIQTEKKGRGCRRQIHPTPKRLLSTSVGCLFSFWVYKQWDGGNETVRDELWDGTFRDSSEQGSGGVLLR
jgi:hypothetical protein